MSTIKTRNCVICGSPDIVACCGHVIRKDMYIRLGELNTDIIIVASKCKKHENEHREDGCYGEYKEWMGICDDPFKSNEKKSLNFTKIADRLLWYITKCDDDEIDRYAERIRVNPVLFRDFLYYAKIEKIGDMRDDYKP